MRILDYGNVEIFDFHRSTPEKQGANASSANALRAEVCEARDGRPMRSGGQSEIRTKAT